jgi:hypothetical protein
MINSAKAVSAGVAFAAGALAVAAATALQGEYKGWGLAQEKAHVLRREDPATWDKEVLDADKELLQDFRGRPFAFGVFPVPRYDLVGTRSFRGAGALRLEFPWHDRYVLGHAFFITRSPVNQEFIGNRKDEVFFLILVLSDQKVRPDGSNASGQIISRNHPHIIGQGLFKTAASEIDYLAFQTADRNAYAVVNMRLFDLRAGRVVLVAPQPDGTLRSVQVEAPVLASTEVKDFAAKLLREPRVVALFGGAR